MGRGRLRRGYSLEVIFEEDPDFCSHLDSLESVGIRFGVKETEDTISVDSLLEDYRIRFQSAADKDHVFQSLDGIWDIREMDRCFVEWDEFSTESMSKGASLGEQSIEADSAPRSSSPCEGVHSDALVQPAGSGGRRSRVSRRQIVEANWVTSAESDESSSSTSSSSSTTSNSSNSSRASSNTNNEDGSKVTVLEPKIQPVLLISKFRVNTGDEPPNTCRGSPPHPIFGQCRIVTGSDKDTLDSYISTRTDETETDAYTFADPFNDSASVASTNYDSTSASSSSAGSVCTVNDRSSYGKGSPVRSASSSPLDHDAPNNAPVVAFACNVRTPPTNLFRVTPTTPSSTASSSPPMISKHCPTHPKAETSASSTSSSGSGGSSCSMDVKKVRALFELPSTWNQRRRFSMAEDVKPEEADAKGLSKKGQQHVAVGKVLRSAYTQFNLGQSSAAQGGQLVDFAELLVNDKVVIEETPSDLYQTHRNKRDQVKGPNSGSEPYQSITTKGTFTTLRRSKSMGTGMSNLGGGSPWCTDGLSKSRPKIIAEEMPAPDTVKNVRTVFERILQLRSTHKQEGSMLNPTNEPGGLLTSSEEPPSTFSIIKKSLSSVKSNPSSKIYRSESLRDDFPSSNFASLMSSQHHHHTPITSRRWGKPILVADDYNLGGGGGGGSLVSSVGSSPVPFKDSNSNRNSLIRRHAKVERKFSEPIMPLKDGACGSGGGTNQGYFQGSTPTLQEESDFSSLSSEHAAKLVSPDVLQRIRSYGTTTTYFGGQIVAQTVKNRKLPVSLANRHRFYNNQNDPWINSSPLNDETTPSQFARMRNEDVFDPCNINTSNFKGLGQGGVLSRRLEEPYGGSGSGGVRRTADFDGIDSFRFGGGQMTSSTSGSGPRGGVADGGVSVDTTPRIISVLPKSPSGSPVGSLMEGRSTPDGCEGQESIKCQWTSEEAGGGCQIDGNNNEMTSKVEISRETGPVSGGSQGQQFSQTVEGAWF